MEKITKRVVHSQTVTSRLRSISSCGELVSWVTNKRGAKDTWSLSMLKHKGLEA